MIDSNIQFGSSAVSGNVNRSTAEALFRNKATFGAIFAVVMAITVALVVLTPRTYNSELTLLVRNSRPDYLLSPERSNGPLVASDITEERINSEINVLRSKDVADVVIDPGWPSRPVAERPEAEIKQHEKAVAEFDRDLNVDLVRKSNVIRVTYVAKSPQTATGTLTRLLQAFLEKQHEMEHAANASTFFATEAERYKQELDDAQEKLAGYQQSNQIVSLPDKEATLQAQINGLADAIRLTQVQLTESTERLTNAKHQLALLPPRLATQQRSVPNTQAVEQLVAMLTVYQNKRVNLLSVYQPTDRLVAEVDAQIATTSAALTNARAVNGQESTTDLNPVYQQVKGGLTSSETDAAALRGKLADLTAQQIQLRQQLAGVEASTVDFSTLQSRVQELQNNYQLFTQKKNESQIADAMDQHQLVNVAVSERPTFSPQPFRPQVAIDLLMGLFTAVFLGLCSVFFQELGRDTVDTPWELEQLAGRPVLATMPLLPHPPAISVTNPRTFGTTDRARGNLDGADFSSAPAGSEGGLGAVARKMPTDASVRAIPRHAEASVPDRITRFKSTPEASAEPLRAPRSLPRTFEQLAAEQVLAAERTLETPPAPLPEAAGLTGPAPPSLGDPCHRQPGRSGNAGAIPARSRLSPSQRERRPTPARGREAFVTYTFENQK